MGDISGGIERMPTLEERKEYQELGTVTPKDKFYAELAKVEQKFVKDFKPFDGQCAKLDFADELERMERESERVYGFINPRDVEKLKFTNLDKYGDMNRFELIDEQETSEQVNINSIKTTVKTGVAMKYKCKRGHGITVIVPMDVYELRKKGAK